MMVYVATYDDGTGVAIRGVFTTKEKAFDFFRAHLKYPELSCDILQAHNFSFTVLELDPPRQLMRFNDDGLEQTARHSVD